MNNTLFRILRGFCGITQTELGAILGLTQSTIAKYEIGTLQITVTVAEQMEQLAKENGITDFDIMLLTNLIKASADAKKVGAEK